MYDPFIPSPDGTVVPTSIALTREQVGHTVHFLDMTVVQSATGCDVRTYNKREDLPPLRNYRRFPHSETLVSSRCKYAVLHSQMCRFAERCTRLDFFERETAKLIHEMWMHNYRPRRLRNKLRNFSSTFLEKSPLHVPGSRSTYIRLRFWSGVQYRVWDRVMTNNFN